MSSPDETGSGESKCVKGRYPLRGLPRTHAKHMPRWSVSGCGTSELMPSLLYFNDAIKNSERCKTEADRLNAKGTELQKYVYVNARSDKSYDIHYYQGRLAHAEDATHLRSIRVKAYLINIILRS